MPGASYRSGPRTRRVVIAGKINSAPRDGLVTNETAPYMVSTCIGEPVVRS
jgi:hypothetical protein